MNRLRKGFTVLELAVVIAILGVLGVVIVSSTGGMSASERSDQARINEVAHTLDRLSRAMAFFEATLPKFSFYQTVGAYPGRLSHLTTPITTLQRNSCGALYSSTNVLAWVGGYFTQDIPTSGLFIAPGFLTADSLVRTPPDVATVPAGTLAIVIPNVTRADAILLAWTIDGDSTGTLGTVRYSPNDGSSPVSVSYLTMVGGC
ncbi:MAG: prepilin-type N-terminal cleavage/methylation domain-containing protein [Gemmatimonadaceae bacterium]